MGRNPIAAQTHARGLTPESNAEDTDTLGWTGGADEAGC